MGLSQNRRMRFQKFFLFWVRISSLHTWNASEVTPGLLAVQIQIQLVCRTTGFHTSVTIGNLKNLQFKRFYFIKKSEISCFIQKIYLALILSQNHRFFDNLREKTYGLGILYDLGASLMASQLRQLKNG